ncbi:MAG: FAD:protein FMN transferase [Bacillus sp. (in: Bacteria)]|nr:FAD:protein FMN transferase [Bacillus sp. (in: firmicutes)]MCM1424994.1 FAD:protein FMN transferase [Eubacterium sp.]
MRKRKKKIFLLISVFLFVFWVGGCQKADEPVTASGFYFDTVIQITIYDAEKKDCLDGCMEIAGKYENMLSPAIEGSDIWNINHSCGRPVTVSDETARLLDTALSYCEMSGGRIDLTMETVSALWDFHTDDTAPGQIPDKKTLTEALVHVDYHNLLIEDNTVTLLDSDTAVSLGFIAKGYIADKIKEYLLSQNVESAIINLGGNLLAVGAKPDGTPFRFGIQTPFDEQGVPITTLSVTDKSVVSSGVYERYFYQDDILYHHILDAASGYPIQNHLLGVTILSDSSTEGDALSTTCFVLGLDEGMELIESLDGVEAVFITDDYRLHDSSGL